jgi:hypothetical protein
MNLLKFSQHRVGQRYTSGQIDCFHLVYDFLTESGAVLPSTFRGISLDDYFDFFKKDPLRAQMTMIDFFEEYLDEIETKSRVTGDILILSYEQAIFVGIDAGNGKVLTVAVELGVNVSPLTPYKIERAFRWHKS